MNLKGLLGIGRFALGVAISAAGGALVVIEKRPRDTGRVARRGREGDPETEWEDVIVVVGIERLSGRIVDTCELITKRLTVEPLVGDSEGAIVLEGLGVQLRRMLADRRVALRGVHLAGDVESLDATGNVMLPPAVVQNEILLAYQTQRLAAVEGLCEGPALLRSLEALEALPAAGPSRDLAIAGALAFWSAARSPSRGPWPSRKMPPNGSGALRELEERHSLRVALIEARAAEEEEEAGLRGRLRRMSRGRR